MRDLQRTARQAVRFLLVSGISLCIDYGIYAALLENTRLDGSWAKRASFACIFVWAFFAHKYFTFKNRSFHPSEPFKFALLYLTGWVLNSFVHDLTAADKGASHPAFLLATFAWACWNFLGQKYYVFRVKETAADSGRS